MLHAENALVSVVLETFNSLASEEDLSPNNNVVNQSLTRYVKRIVDSEDVVEDKEIVLNHHRLGDVMRPLMDILSRAEYEMESYFAKKLAEGGPMPLSGLSRFWYRANYKALVDLELDGLKRFSNGLNIMTDPRPIAFVGSGPLPLSAIDYYNELGKTCDCIEMNELAVNESRGLIKALGLQDSIRVINKNGCNVDYGAYSMIFIAALAEDKATLLKRIRETANHAMVAARSADGLKKLLYMPVDVRAVEACGFAHCGTTLGTRDAVNSTCFFKMV